jgi:hypothetical protein
VTLRAPAKATLSRAVCCVCRVDAPAMATLPLVIGNNNLEIDFLLKLFKFNYDAMNLNNFQLS